MTLWRSLPTLMLFVLLLPVTSRAKTTGVTVAEVMSSINDSEPSIVVAAREKKKKSREVTREKIGEEEEVDLSAMEESAPAESGKSNNPHGPHGGASGTEPHFSVLFDLIAANRPGRENFSFMNFHPLLFFEIVPTSNIVFSFEVNPSPRYFELDYQATKALTLRVGRIWIPFDDLNPHNMFGGIIGTSRMAFGSTPYLPDIWADLGIGAKWVIVDNKQIRLESHLYVVNGFAASSTANTDVSFASFPTTDNNDAKSIGGRIHAVVARMVGVGLSFHTGRWDYQAGDSPDRKLRMLGADFQLRLPKTEIKLGVSTMYVENAVSYNRTGQYLEVQQKFGERDEFRLVGRVGALDTDDRIVNDSDNTIVGGGIRWKPNVVTLSLEHYQDLRMSGDKTSHAITFIRSVVQL